MDTVKEEARYVAHCSAVKGITISICGGIFLIGSIIFFIMNLLIIAVIFLAIGVILGIAGCLCILSARFNKIIFYDNKVVERKGIINTKEKSSILTGIVGVSVQQSLFGKIFNYGDIVIDKMGRGWDVSTKQISRPHELKKYLEKLIDKTQVNNNINTFLSN